MQEYEILPPFINSQERRFNLLTDFLLHIILISHHELRVVYLCYPEGVNKFVLKVVENSFPAPVPSKISRIRMKCYSNICFLFVVLMSESDLFTSVRKCRTVEQKLKKRHIQLL
jgi:hypothetical protein